MAPGFLPYETYRWLVMAEPSEQTVSRGGRRAIIVVIIVGLTVIPLAFISIRSLFSRKRRLET